MSGLDEKGELLPCPFCGGRDIEIRATKIGDYFAICHSDYEGEMHCGASTDPSRCETPEGAVRRWSRRMPLSAVGQKAGTVEDTQANRERENTAFHDWWKSSGHEADPTFTLTMQNCAHAAWQARALIHAPSVAEAAEPVKVTYTNWRGETSEREIRPLHMWFGATEWHPEPQWLITAKDIGKGVERDFALAGFGHPAPSPVVPSGLEALVERLRERWEATDAPVSKKINRLIKLCREAADAIAALIAERDEALAEIERMTPNFVAYEYLESPAGREVAEAKLAVAEARIIELEAALDSAPECSGMWRCFWNEKAVAQAYENALLRAGNTTGSTPADIITRLMPIADDARKAGINFNPFVDLAKQAFERALEASPDWHGPIDGEMTDEHFDRDERR